MPYSNADHLNTANECMQPAAGGGFRSLEINNQSGQRVTHGYGANWTARTPSSAISIVGAYTPPNTVFVDCNLHQDGFTAQYFWSGGTQAINYINYCDSSLGYGFGDGINASFAPSSYFGWGAGCWLASSCSTSSSIGAVLGVQGIRLTAQENTGPSLIAAGANNLWYQSSHWVRGGGWPVTFAASDPSGVCLTDLIVNGKLTTIDYTNDPSPDTSSFTQCSPNDTATGTLNTRSYADGPLTIVYAANNAANVVSAPNQTLQVDNTPVTLALSTPNDADRNVWVNHSVQALADATAGPSGLAGTSCSTNSGASYGYPSGGITLDGTGIWRVACSSSNNALDVNGQAATSPTETIDVHIDETPPTVTFEPQNPADPQAVVADAGDGESGVAGGQIQMRPVTATTWTKLATSFDGSRLAARFDDATLSPGQWFIQATACDNAGNCASTERSLTLPVRTASVASVGFGEAKDAAGGCSERRALTKRRHQHPNRICHTLRLALKRQERLAFGQQAELDGVLTTAHGSALGDVPVVILAAPDNGIGATSQIASVRTNSAGAWRLRIPAGPSRLISAVFAGSTTLQPSRASATLIVPASVRVLRVWPRHVAWSGKVRIRAQLRGGFLPAEGALVRLRLGYGNAKTTYGVREHVTGNGIFEVTNVFGPGPSGLIRHYWLQECTLPEGDYPFAPACGARSAITVGGSGS